MQVGTLTTMTTDSPERATDTDALDASASPVAARSEAQKAFNTSIIVSGIRCTLAYVVLPFIAPLIGLAPGVGPVIGIPIATVAIIANAVSIRRFWRAQHPWKVPITILNVLIIGLMVVLIANDLRTLLT